MVSLVLKTIPAILAMLVFIISGGVASARVSVKEVNKYYNVRGKTASQVFDQIKRKGPRHRGLRRAVATTKINLKMGNVKIGVRGRRCVVNGLQVMLSLEYKYPRWRNIKQGRRQARKNWNAYYKQVVRHEKTHGEIAKKMASDLDRAIKKVTDRKSRNCSRMARKIERVFNKLNKEHDRKQSAFDTREHRRSSNIMKLQRVFTLSN